jgi:hypothetical protein
MNLVYTWEDQSVKGLVHRSAPIVKEQHQGTGKNLYPGVIRYLGSRLPTKDEAHLKLRGCWIKRRNFLQFESKFFKNGMNDPIFVRISMCVCVYMCACARACLCLPIKT